MFKKGKSFESFVSSLISIDAIVNDIRYEIPLYSEFVTYRAYKLQSLELFAIST